VKIFLWFLPCLLICPFLWAQDSKDNDSTPDTQEENIIKEDDTPSETSEKKKFRLKNRTVELSVANISFGFSNDVIAAADIIKNPFYIIKNINDIKNDPSLVYKDTVDIDIDNFSKGINFNFDAAIKPFSFNFNWKDKWGFGLDIAHIDVMGDISLSGNMLTLKESKLEKSGVGAAVFIDVGIPVFFHASNLKIKVRPAVYLPLLYTEPSITYTGQDGTNFNISYNMYIYAPFIMSGLQDGNMDALTQDMQDNYRNMLKNNLGYDFKLSAEYPLNRWFDIGVDFVNIPVPFATAKLNHFLQYQGEAFFNTNKIDINKIIENEGDLPENFWDDVYGYTNNDPVTGYDSAGKRIFRPFTMLFYAYYRPFGSRIFSLIPSLGFSFNRLYTRPAAVEGGLSACFDFANIFITTLGVNYNDHKWKNSVDFVLNLRVFEFDLGLVFQSQNFVKSWQGAGLGVNFGLKLGF
jgi:hypothetical protein